MLSVRRAGVDDLDAVVELTQRRRRSLARWSPLWWRPAVSADEAHRQWLSYLLTTAAAECRVVLDGDHIIGCAVVVGQSSHAFIDDLAVDGDQRWPSVVLALVDAIGARPALSCVPTADADADAAVAAAGFEHVASYWLLEPAPHPSPGVFQPFAGDVPAGPAHTFEVLFDAQRAMLLSVGDGVAVASGSVAAPPIFDPGGPVRIVDRVLGPHPDELLRSCLGAAHDAGDVIVCVVSAADDATLNSALAELNAIRTVDVVEWPRSDS